MRPASATSSPAVPEQVSANLPRNPDSTARQQQSASTSSQAPTSEDELSVPGSARESSPYTTPPPTSVPEKRFILLCINAKNFEIKLKHINVTYAKDDQFLFFKIREAYKELRGKRFGAFSLMLPASVQVIKV